ncbi:MAG: tRNA lysidine(34) synthetase TilS, partial [Actinomycetota bacterium]
MNSATLEVRRAVRETLAELDRRRPVLVACSGGPDSLALAAAVAFRAERDGRRAGAVTVDHGLSPGSADRAREVAAAMSALGLDPVEVVHALVAATGRGPEGDARAARYGALDAAASRHGAAAVLLGQTRDDQAETVLLGLARGSGARSLAGMAPASGHYRRPLLDLPRETVRSAVPAGLVPWEDPDNVDPAYARARVRHRVLPVLEAELGPGVAAALARTADLLRADADGLDEWADRAAEQCLVAAPPVAGRDDGTAVRLDVPQLAALPLAVRSRVLRRAAIVAGSPPTDLTAGHVRALDALVTRWHGQRGVDLPGGVRAARRGQMI